MRYVLMVAVALFVAACTSETHELKSPCVGTEKSPCAKRPLNGPLHG